MRKSRFSDEQITQVLSEDRNGVPVSELFRKHGISTNTFYSWRRKFGGLQGQEVRRLKELETTVSRVLGGLRSTTNVLQESTES